MSGLEIIGVAASIGALVEIADRAYKVVFKYMPAVKNARKDVQRLITEIRNLCGVLHSLKIFAASLEDDDLLGPDPKAFRMQHVESCYHTLSKIRSDLEKVEADMHSKNKLRGFQRSLRWPFSEEETTKLLDRVNADKQTMNLAMTVDSTSALLRKLSRYHHDVDRQMAEIKSDVRKTLEITRRVDINSKRRGVLDFFNRSEAQASEFFETSVASRFPLTGLWLIQGDKLRNWLTTSRSSLWLAGIPGAGKTVLAGAIIEEALSLCNPGYAAAFFFCDSSKGTAASLTDLLGVLAVQIARQHEDAFEILEQYHAELNPEQGMNRAATVKGISVALVDMINCLDRVYLVVDGLDEYGSEATEIITALTEIWESTETCSIALLSRDEAHIREQLEDDFEYVHVKAHKEDIEPYVIAKIQERFGDKKKRKISEATKEAITKALVERSFGMFRWVTCQIQYICEFSTDKERLEALNNLPPDLAKTYERILDRVNQKGQHIQTLVQRVLCLIDFREKPITIAELREAVSTHILDPNDLIPEDEIALRCSSLIRRSNDGSRFEYAHFTVREFLRSSELLGTPYEKYHISDAKVIKVLASTSIRFLLRSEFSEEQRDYDLSANQALARAQAHPFYSYASKFWTTAKDKSWWEDAEVEQLLLQLFRYPKTGNFVNLAIETFRHLLRGDVWLPRPPGPRIPPPPGAITIPREFIATVTRADFTPLHLSAILAIPWLTRHLLSTGLDVNSTSRAGTPLHCAVMGTCMFGPGESILRQLALGPFYIFNIMGECAKFKTVKILLEAGANPSEVCHTPTWSHTPLTVALQAGRGTSNFDLFLELLSYGASVDKKTCTLASDLFDYIHRQSNVHTEAALKAAKGLTALVEGILKVTATEPALPDESSALRAATLRFISASDRRFNWATSTVKPSYSSIRGFQNADQAFQDAQLAIKFGDVEAVRRIIDSSGDSLITKKMPNGGTLLHYSVASMVPAVVPVLEDSGFDPNLMDDRGFFTPVSMCYRDEHVPLLKELLRCGGKTDVANKHGETIWHLAARYNSVDILDILIHESGEEKTQALSRVNNFGFSPFALSLMRGSLKPALFILSQAQGDLSCLTTPPGFGPYREATKTTRSDELIRAMLDAGIPPEPVLGDGDTPLHYLRLQHGPEVVSLLKGLYPKAGRRSKDNRTPLELLLSTVFIHGPPTLPGKGWNTVDQLVRGTALMDREGTVMETSQEDEEAIDLWSFLDQIIPERVTCYLLAQLCASCSAQLRTLLSFLLNRGQLEKYEARHGSSGLLPLLSCFKLKNQNAWRWNLISTAQEPLRRVVRETKYWETAKSDQLILDLLGVAIFRDWPWVVDLFLERGIDVHLKAASNRVSALEMTCIMKSQCSVATFSRVLDSADPTRLNETTYAWDQLGLIHITALSGINIRAEKLKILIQKGVDINQRTGKGVPPMVFHMVNNASLECAQILLEAGGNPNLQDPNGWDALHAAVKINNISFLEEVKRLADANPGLINWKQTCRTIREDSVVYSQCNALHIAALNPLGKLESLRFYLDGGYVDEMSPFTAEGYSYLHLAAERGNVEAIKLLGSHSSVVATINSQAGETGLLPLDMAILWGGHPEVVQVLLDLGADKTLRGYNGHTPMIHALIQEKPNIAEILDPRDNKQDVHQVAKKNQEINMREALEDAIEQSRLLACQHLWGKGCPLNKPVLKCGGCSPLLLAILEGRSAIVAWMVNNCHGINLFEPLCKECASNGWEYSPVPALAAETRNLAPILPLLMKAYLKAGGRPFLEDRNPFHGAARGRKHEAIHILVQHIKENVDLYRITHSSVLDGCTTTESVIKTMINIKTGYQDSCGRSPLHLAVLYMKEGESIATVVELLRNGADPNQQDDEGKTPLLLLANSILSWDTLEDAFKELLNAGALLELRDWLLRTPLLEAVSTSKVEAVQMLLQHGANPHAIDDQGMSALGLSRKASLFRQFLDIGLDPFYVDPSRFTPALYGLGREDTRAMVLNRLDIRNIPPLGHCSVLSDAVIRTLEILTHLKIINRRQLRLGRPEIVKLEPRDGKSPLYLASEYGDLDAVRSVLRLGAQIDFADFNGDTALMIACSHGNFAVVKLLIGNGAAISYVDNKTGVVRSALEEAKRFPQIIHWLLVGKSSYRKRLEVGGDETESPRLMPWSGLWAAQLPLCRADQEWNGREFADFAHRNSRLRRQFAGTVASFIRRLGPSHEVERP
ncbi:ankyrin repeat-containing domain protein [Podospora fimiseda]|uniref:Ankyrin repeat-containing domain protein n=1 Tax=Podospora fimiseda TaxID=252190 RepID=A0AAN6YMH5_9PEZI|nr:ankyrin repeat-containing domain protein [Podospora fimiseda]